MKCGESRRTGCTSTDLILDPKMLKYREWPGEKGEGNTYIFFEKAEHDGVYLHAAYCVKF